MLWGSPSAPAQAPNSKANLAVFDAVWDTVRENYYDPNLRGVDWVAQRAEYRLQAAQAADKTALYGILRRVIGPLQDSHTRLFAADEKSDWQRPRSLGIGVMVREIEGQAVVVAVERDAPAARAGLRAGAVIEAVDGVPALEVFAQRLAAQTASTPAAARWRAMATLFTGATGQTVRVTWRDDEGKLREVASVRRWADASPMMRVRYLPEKIAVVEFNLFTLETSLALTRAWRKDLQKARGVIFDLRGNGGGNAQAMAEIASALLPTGTKLGRFSNRSGAAVTEPQTLAKHLFAADSIPRYYGPVAILTSPRTASAAEVLVAALRENQRARIFGQVTCGCVLAVTRYTLPDGGALDVSTLDYHTANRKHLEGIGLEPDEQILPTRREVLRGEDAVLEAARVWLVAQSPKQ